MRWRGWRRASPLKRPARPPMRTLDTTRARTTTCPTRTAATTARRHAGARRVRPRAGSVIALTTWPRRDRVHPPPGGRAPTGAGLVVLLAREGTHGGGPA